MNTYTTQHEVIHQDKDFGQTTIAPGTTLTDAQVKALSKDLDSLERAGALKKNKAEAAKAEQGVNRVALKTET